jgi:hypothetical protein
MLTMRENESPKLTACPSFADCSIGLGVWIVGLAASSFRRSSHSFKTENLCATLRPAAAVPADQAWRRSSP